MTITTTKMVMTTVMERDTGERAPPSTDQGVGSKLWQAIGSGCQSARSFGPLAFQVTHCVTTGVSAQNAEYL